MAKLSYFLVISAALFVFSSYAQWGGIFSETQGSGGVKTNVRHNPTQVFSTYLGCLNRIRSPIAHRLIVEIEEGGTPESDTAIFWGEQSGDGGIFTVKPNGTSFDNVPLYDYSGGTPPGYPWSYTDSNEDEYVSHFFVYDGKGDVASIIPPGSLAREYNADVPFYPIGKPESRIDNQEAMTAIAREVTPAIRSMPETLTGYLEDLEGEGYLRPGDKERCLEMAKEALCKCMNTNQPSIVEVSQAAAKSLNFADEEILGCHEPLVSELDIQRHIFEFMFQSALAEPERKNQLSKVQFEVQMAQKPLSIRYLRAKEQIELRICSASGLSRYDAQTGRILSKSKKCSRKELGLGSAVSNIEKLQAKIIGNRVVVRTE